MIQNRTSRVTKVDRIVRGLVVITQARMASTRLPGKVLMDIGGKTMLELHLDRLRRVHSAEAVIVACPDTRDSDPIADLCARLGVPCVRGPEQDVLERYRLAAETHGAEVVIRATSDNPFVDPTLLDELVQLYVKSGVDYAFIGNDRNGGYPYGLNAEVFSKKLLDEVSQLASLPAEREHVMPYVNTRPDQYRLKSLPGGEGADLRLTVDVPADLDRARRLYAALEGKSDFNWRDCVAALRAHPEWDHTAFPALMK